MRIRTREGTYQTRAANPYAPWGSTAPPPPGSMGGFGGVRVDEQTALQQIAVYGSVSLISEQIATLPIQQWKMVAGEPVKMDPAPVIAQPWSEIDQGDFITQGTMSMLLRGDLWGRAVGFDDRGLPTQVKPIHPNGVKTTRNQQTGQIEVYYGNELVPSDQVVHKMALSLPEHLRGLSPIEYLRNTIGLARAQDLHAGAFYSNGTRPDYIIEVDGDLDEDETVSMSEALKATHQGINKSWLPLILTGGAKAHPITMSMADAQFLQQMQFSASMISGFIYRIPAHMLSMTDKATSWGSGIEQQELAFVRNTLLIWLKRWEDVLRTWLPPKQFVTFDLSQRLRGDTLQRFQAYQIGRICGFMNNMDALKAEGMPIPTDPDLVAQLTDYAAPLNSSPMKVGGQEGPGGDKAE